MNKGKSGVDGEETTAEGNQTHRPEKCKRNQSVQVLLAINLFFFSATRT
jgi:hypothetical protein